MLILIEFTKYTGWWNHIWPEDSKTHLPHFNISPRIFQFNNWSTPTHALFHSTLYYSRML